MTPSSFAKSVGFAKRQARYLKPSVGLVGGEGGRSGQCLKAALVFRYLLYPVISITVIMPFEERFEEVIRPTTFSSNANDIWTTFYPSTPTDSDFMWMEILTAIAAGVTAMTLVATDPIVGAIVHSLQEVWIKASML